MSNRPSWDNQFWEDHDEKQERWRKRKEQRRREGKCWQCAALIADCKCPNITHPPDTGNDPRPEGN